MPGRIGSSGPGAIQRLDLALFIEAEHQRVIGRMEIQPDDVAHLLDKLRVGGELEGIDAVRLEAERPPDAGDGRFRQPGDLRHAARRPLRRMRGRSFEGARDDVEGARAMTMRNRTIVGLLLVCCAWGAAAHAAQRATTTTCDRECLRGKVTQLLSALVKHDVSGLPVAATLRVTEDAVEKPLAKVGLVGTVTRLRGFRQDIIDEGAGVAGAHVMVEETGAPVLLVVRLKVVADKLTEIELVATRSRAEGLIFNIDGLSAPSAVMNYAPRPEQLATRDAAIKAALHYPEGLNAAKTFAAVNAPFAPDAYRYENGQVMAGPDCKFAPGCQNISTQSLAIFERLGDVQTRVIAVDERMGIVWLRMAWGVRERGGDQLTVWEMFKVFDGQIHAVEAFMRILPVEKRNGGWE